MKNMTGECVNIRDCEIDSNTLPRTRTHTRTHTHTHTHTHTQGLLHLYHNISKIRWDGECSGVCVAENPRERQREGERERERYGFLVGVSL